MELLIDTHVALWWFDDPSRLSLASHSAIGDLKNEVYVSAVVAWEIAIKRGLGKLTAPDDLLSAMAASYFDPLPVTFEDAMAVETLPYHHRDPFDRLLIAQALQRGWTIVTRDPVIPKYAAKCLLA